MRPIWAYAVERFPLRVFAPAIAIHGLLAWWTAGARPMALAASLGLTALLVALFRLWDDLEDVERDRTAHPGRVLVRSDAATFRRLLLLLTVVATAPFASTIAGAASFGGLLGALWIGYRSLRPRLADRTWRFGVLLLKYPAFVVLVADAIGNLSPSRAGAAAVCSYVAAASYECWHHDRGPARHKTSVETGLYRSGALR